MVNLSTAGRQGGDARVHGEARPGVHRRVGTASRRHRGQHRPRARSIQPSRSSARTAATTVDGASASAARQLVERGRFAMAGLGAPRPRRPRAACAGRAVARRARARARPARRRVRARHPRRRTMSCVGARGRRVAPGSGIRHHRAAVFERVVGGDARTALQRRLDDDHHLREPGDDPVAHRERVPARLHAVAELAHEQARRPHPVEQHAVAARVHDVEPGGRPHRPPRRPRRARPRARRRRSRSRGRSPP